MGRILLGMVLAIVLVPLIVLGWLRFGNVPVAVADPPLPQEMWLTGIPLHARIERDAPKAVPLQADEANLVAGAQIYRDQCALCHGLHGKPSQFGDHMFPMAPPLWEVHHHGSEAVVGVSDDPPGETYWKIANGIRLTGMPSFRGALTEDQMWQVSLLLANADKPLPPAALNILKGVPPAEPAPAAAAAKAKEK